LCDLKLKKFWPVWWLGFKTGTFQKFDIPCSLYQCIPQLLQIVKDYSEVLFNFSKDFSWHDGAAISKTCLADACLEIRTNASKVYLVNCFLQIHKKAQKIMWHCQNMYPYIVVKAAIVK
jgi:hypothetical protein